MRHLVVILRILMPMRRMMGEHVRDLRRIKIVFPA